MSMNDHPDESWKNYPVRYTIPMHLHTRLIDAIGHRAMRLVGEHHPARNKVVSHAEDARAIRQAKAEAMQEAIEDWLAKPKDAKWLAVEERKEEPMSEFIQVPAPLVQTMNKQGEIVDVKPPTCEGPSLYLGIWMHDPELHKQIFGEPSIESVPPATDCPPFH